MVKSCSAYNCTARFVAGATFHKFPKEASLRKRWIASLRRDKWEPSSSSFLCWKHFEPDDYEISGWAKKKTLKSDAVPSIFNFPPRMTPKKIKRSSPKKRSCSISTVGEEQLIKTDNEEETQEMYFFVEKSEPEPFFAVESLMPCSMSTVVEEQLTTDNEEETQERCVFVVKSEPEPSFAIDPLMPCSMSTVVEEQLITTDNEEETQERCVFVVKSEPGQSSAVDAPSLESSGRKYKKRKHYVGDFEHFSALTKAKEVIDKKNKLLKLEKQKNRRLQMRITMLEDMIFHLNEKYSAKN